jgi:hypothetical protein
MLELLREHITVLMSTLISGLAGFLFGRKKQSAELAGMNAENEGKEIDNAEKLIHLYKESLNDLGDRYEKKFQDFVRISEQKTKLLEDEIALHKRVISNLKKEISMLKKEVSN